MGNHKLLLPYLFLFVALFTACEKPPEKEALFGIWALNTYRSNGFDQTEIVNKEHQQWIEFQENNSFRSGGRMIEDNGQWFYNPQTGILQIHSTASKWGNTTWEVSAHPDRLLLKHPKNSPRTLFLNALFYKRDKLPAITKHVSSELDGICGLWNIDSMSTQNQINKDLPYEWIRLENSGTMRIGDFTGELFARQFTYDSESNKLTTVNRQTNSSDDWIVNWDQHDALLLITKDTSLTVHMTRVQEFSR